MSSSIRRLAAALSTLVVAAATLSACGSDAKPAAAPSAASSAVDLAAAGCPATVAVQTDWLPQSEYGYLYGMLGTGYTVDTKEKSVTGPLFAGGKATGVNLKILTGGPAIGYQTAASQLAAKPDIYMATIGTDEALQASADYKVTSVFAPEEKSPAAIMWDPATYPDVKTIADLGHSAAIVRYGKGQPFMNYLLDQGLLDKKKLDGSYDGTPGAFIAAHGKDAQYGYASSDTYVFEHETDGWDKPLKWQLIADTGYDPYVSTAAVLSSKLTTDAGCLSKLVPVMQQAVVDYFRSPAATNAIIVKLVQQYKMGFTYSAGLAAFSAKTQLADKLVGDGPNHTVGDFDPARMSTQFDIVTGILKETKVKTPSGITPQDFYTNKFINPKIGM